MNICRSIIVFLGGVEAINKFIKWFGLIIILGSFPIWCRFIMSTYPESNTNRVSVSDLLFFNISIHISTLYNFLELKKDNVIISLLNIISVFIILFYIIYIVMYMQKEQDIVLMIIICTIFSLIFSIGCHIFMLKDNKTNLI